MLYKGNKKFKTLRRGNQVITRLFKGDELIFKDVEALYGFRFTIDTTMTSGGTHDPNYKGTGLKAHNNAEGPAFSLTVLWGDGNSDVWNLSSNSQYTLYHTYDTAGTYQITILPNTFIGAEPMAGWLSRIVPNVPYQVISVDKKYPDNSYIAERGATPTDHVITKDVIGFFTDMYNITYLPAGFLNNISIRENPHTTSLNKFFARSFANFGQNTNLSLDNYLVNWLDDLEFSEVTDFSYMFANCFDSAIVSESKVQRFMSSLRTPVGTNFSYMFNNSFGDQLGRGHSWDTIPADFFPPLDTSNGTDFSGMFSNTFSYTAMNSTTATIPAGLFDFLDTSNGTNFSQMFSSTFFEYAINSPVCTIPAGLFDSLDVTNGTNFSGMFYSTFSYCCPKSTVATIPAGLFDSIVTTNGTNFTSMFARTFQHYCEKSTAAQIPSGLFASIDLSGGTSAESLFDSTFEVLVNNNNIHDITVPSNLFALDFSNCINFSNTFKNVFSGIHTNTSYGLIVPDDLFTMDTANGVKFNNMFEWAFSNTRMNNFAPTSLFNFTSTSNGTTFQSMFHNTFQGVSMQTPAGLFSHIDTSNATVLASMFYGTFSSVGFTAIPATLFSTITTTNATNASGMFQETFNKCGASSAVSIPATLFSTIDTSGIKNVSNMFNGVFSSTYCQVYPEGIFGGIDLSAIPGETRNVTGIFTSAFRYDGITAGVRNYNWEIKDVFDGMADFSWATAANASTVLNSMFAYSRQDASLDNTIGSASTILQHFNFTPNSRTQMFANRTNLTDYATINANWK